MNKLYLLLFFPFLLFVTSSCSGDSYDKRVQKQKKSIKKFISDKDILYTYPSDHHFEENQYYKEPGSLMYYRVINPGKLSDSLTVKDRDRANIPVTIMFDSVKMMVSKSVVPGDYNQSGEPIVFTYGDISTYSTSNTYSYGYYYMSESLVIPLQKGLGTNAEIEIIVPFQNGSFYQQTYYEPLLLYRLRYTYYKQMENED